MTKECSLHTSLPSYQPVSLSTLAYSCVRLYGSAYLITLTILSHNGKVILYKKKIKWNGEKRRETEWKIVMLDLKCLFDEH